MNNQPFREIWVELKKDEKEALATAVESSVNNLSQLAHGHRRPGKRFARDLAKNIGDGATRNKLFPDAFAKPTNH
ncbi:MAG: hypothetical protein RPU90_04390 [Candidatus Sedimenticola sp. (ex Thyasira tokunagai)]